MKKIMVLVIAGIVIYSFCSSAWAEGGKVRGAKGKGKVHQVNFNSQGNQG